MIQQDIRDYKRLLGFVRPHLPVLLIAMIFMLLFSLFEKISLTTVIPIMDKIVTNQPLAIPGQEYAPRLMIELMQRMDALPRLRLLEYILIFATSGYLLRCIFQFLYTYFMADLGQLVIRDVRDRLYNKFLSLSMSFYGNNPTGKLVSRVTYDAALVKDSISMSLRDMIVEPIQVAASLTLAIFIKLVYAIPWSLLFLSLVCIPAIIISVTRIGRRIRQISRKQQEQMGGINTVLYDTISGIRIVKAFSMESYETGRFKGQNSRFYRIAMKSVLRMSVIGPVTEFLGVACVVPVFWLAGRQILEGSIAWGPFTVFIGSLMLIVKPVKKISKLQPVIQAALAAAVRIFSIYDERSDIKERPDAVRLAPLKESVAFEHAAFSYGDNMVFRDVNFTVRKGEIVAFVGSSGAGKTTAVNLIPRFYDVSGGAVKIDGTDIRDATLTSLRAQIGIVTQDTILFNDTVAANISYGNTGRVAREDIVKAAQIANAHDFIRKMPEGYDTIVGEKGFRLSGGEKQRLAIARAVFKNPPILILDEATSQLDAESELLVQDAIDRLMKGRTVFAIAHRLATIKNATRILVLESGTICDEGTHEELIRKSGLYQRLYNLQFQLT